MLHITCASIGYQQRRVHDLCETLAAESVEILVDVRAAAWSQRPEYRKQALKKALSEHGIDYIHCKEAGNPYRPRRGQALEFDVCARMYAEHLRSNPEVVDHVSQLVAERVAALFCYESHRDHCHRGVIFEALKKRMPGLTVLDL